MDEKCIQALSLQWRCLRAGERDAWRVAAMFDRVPASCNLASRGRLDADLFDRLVEIGVVVRFGTDRWCMHELAIECAFVNSSSRELTLAGRDFVRACVDTLRSSGDAEQAWEYEKDIDQYHRALHLADELLQSQALMFVEVMYLDRIIARARWMALGETLAVNRTVRFGSFELDLRGGSLREAGRSVELDRKQLLVLICLIEHRGRVVSANELLSAFGSSEPISSTVLGSIVQGLQRCLGEGPAPDRWIGSDGIGYGFIGNVAFSLSVTLLNAHVRGDDEVMHGDLSWHDDPSVGPIVWRPKPESESNAKRPILVEMKHGQTIDWGAFENARTALATSGAAKVFRMGGFQLDGQGLRAGSQGEVLPLQPKSLRLLRYLIEHRTRIVTRYEVEEWWGSPMSEGTGVRTALWEIRNALGDASQRWIATHRGVGYQFIGEVEEQTTEPVRTLTSKNPSDASELVGREDEIRRLRSSLRASRLGTCRVVLLSGSAGIGKTWTVLHFAREARGDGFDFHIGRSCVDSGGAPYRPWIEIFRSLERARGLPELRGAAQERANTLSLLIPELLEPQASPPGVELESDRARFIFFDCVVAFLSDLARRRPVVLFLDDLQWADAGSLLLLAFIARSRVPAPLLIVGAHRDLGPHSEDVRAHALARAYREGSVESIRLGGLTSESIARILEARLGAAPQEELAQEIYLRSGGNPFFVAEFARMLEGRRISARDPQGYVAVPALLQDVVRLRISECSDLCRKLLQLASVIGEHCSLPVLRRTFGGRADELLEALAEAEHWGLLVREVQGRYRFAHNLFRETLYGELEEGKRAEMHRSVGTALEGLHGSID